MRLDNWQVTVLVLLNLGFTGLVGMLGWIALARVDAHTRVDMHRPTPAYDITPRRASDSDIDLPL